MHYNTANSLKKQRERRENTERNLKLASFPVKKYGCKQIIHYKVSWIRLVYRGLYWMKNYAPIYGKTLVKPKKNPAFTKRKHANIYKS